MEQQLVMQYLNILLSEIYKIGFILIPILVSVALIVWLDRRVWGAVQKRRGPNVVGPFGLLQTAADALKYILKEIIIPASSNKIIFILAPVVTMTLALVAWQLFLLVIICNCRHKCWNSLSFCRLFTRSLWNYYGWMGV